MAISLELAEFYNGWRAKAREYPINEIRSAFDRFFTLYVAFNRLYAEATFRLARRGQTRLRDRFPDSKAAQDYVLQFCGAEAIIGAWERAPATVQALREIGDHLRTGRFALKLNIVTGEKRPQADRELLKGLESRSLNRRAKSGLEVLYAIRCNMFHGHKGFEPVQLELLRPAIHLLEVTINVLHESLEQDNR